MLIRLAFPRSLLLNSKRKGSSLHTLFIAQTGGAVLDVSSACLYLVCVRVFVRMHSRVCFRLRLVLFASVRAIRTCLLCNSSDALCVDQFRALWCIRSSPSDGFQFEFAKIQLAPVVSLYLARVLISLRLEFICSRLAYHGHRKFPRVVAPLNVQVHFKFE